MCCGRRFPVQDILKQDDGCSTALLSVRSTLVLRYVVHQVRFLMHVVALF